ncbi:monocarboxylate transporter 13-like [Amphiura filiformis]|uniref:monocarboxylate transporter 13-like n=1 Tax=Amphiura filiformis TaxID=82378 RepID=UPI003B214A02
MPSFIQEFDDGFAVLGWISSSGFAIMNLAGPFASIFVNKFGCRITTLMGGLLLSTGMMLASFANSTTVLFLFLGVLTGIGASLVFLSVPIILSQHFTKHYSTAVGIAYTGCSIGVSVFPLLTTKLISVYGWNGAILLQGALSLNIVLMGMLFKHKPPKHQRKTVSDTKKCENMEINEFQSSFQPLHNNDIHRSRTASDQDCNIQMVVKSDLERSNSNHPNSKHLDVDEDDEVHITSKSRLKPQCTKCPGVLLLCTTPIILFAYITTFLVSISYAAALTHITNQVVLMGFPSQKAALVLSSLGIGGAFGRAFHGWFVDHNLLSASTLYECALLVASAGTLMNPVLNRYFGCVISAVTIGVTVGILYPLFYTIMKQMLGLHQFVTASGLAHFFDGCGVMTGAYMAGLIHDKSGSYQTGIYIFAALFFLAACVFIPVVIMLRRQKVQ